MREETESPEEEEEQRFALEDFTRCSESHLWKLMMSFYDRKGVKSWSQGIVPHFITCNAFIGRAYAKVLLGFIRDCMRPDAKVKLSEAPLYIIELGAGSGKFSFFMLKALLEYECPNFVYVMTDFTQNNLNFWNQHPSLRPYIESGHLDLAIFDAVNDTSLKLFHSNKILGPNTLENPVCIIANYLFDTLCHDIFQIDGCLKEGLISVGTKQFEPDALDPEIIKRFENRFKYQEVNVDYYDEPDSIHFKRILKWYLNYFQNSTTGASVLMPIGALRALRRLTSFSGGRALVLSGDKGNNNPEQFRGLMDPHIAVHGSFSVMVNYHAIGLYFISRSGFVLHNPQEEASLKVSAFVLTGDSDDQWENDMSEKRKLEFPHLCRVFYDEIVRFGPNDFFVLQKSMKEDSSPTLKGIIALLKLGDWDPDVFYKFRDVILNQAPVCGVKLRNDLCRDLPRVWENHYSLDKDKDVSFEVGRFYYGIREHEKALQFYRTSTEHTGEHHVTFHNMGLCYYSLGQLDVALLNFEKSLQLNCDYEKARSWHQKVQREIQRHESLLALQPAPAAAEDGDSSSSKKPPPSSQKASSSSSSSESTPSASAHSLSNPSSS